MPRKNLICFLISAQVYRPEKNKITAADSKSDEAYPTVTASGPIMARTSPQAGAATVLWRTMIGPLKATVGKIPEEFFFLLMKWLV